MVKKIFLLTYLVIFCVLLTSLLPGRTQPVSAGAKQGKEALSRINFQSDKDNVPFDTIPLPPSAKTITLDETMFQRKVRNPKLDTTMSDLVTAAKASDINVLDLARTKLLCLANGRVLVQITTIASNLDVVVNAVGKVGGEVTGVGRKDTLIQAWLLVGAIGDLAALPEVQYIKRPAEPIPLEGTVTSEGVAVMNANSWHAKGYRGAGVKVGIIDLGFMGYPDLLGSDLPASVTVKNFVDGETDAQVNGTTVHGSANSEIIFDIAPEAQLYLAKILTDLDLEEAMLWLKNTHHVDVISTSVGWFNGTPGDGTGYFADLVSQARAAGILWATAAGNNRETHWGGLYTDIITPTNNIHEFNGTQEVNYFGPGNGDAYVIPTGELLEVYLRWDDWTTVNQDYDLYLLRWNGVKNLYEIFASSVNLQTGAPGQSPTEAIVTTSSGSATVYGYIIYRDASDRVVNFESFSPSVPHLDEVVNGRSLYNLADAPDAVTVAAVDVVSPYNQESFSSEGPTNGTGGTLEGGFTKPDLAAYDKVSTVSYGAEPFSGTSAATPHVAGAAALVSGAFPSFSPDQVQTFLESRAIDMGTVGMDNQYGYGRLNLGTPPNVVYLPVILR